MDEARIAVYIRLSMADEETGRSKAESNSVANQRSLIHRFLDGHAELSQAPRTEFVDDGYTGTNTSRPAFREMVAQIKEGRYNVCITKDFSRFSRDYIEMGDYLECLFPFLRVRYISINDGYDSRDYRGTTGGLDVVMRNIVYASYSRDLSVKESTGKLPSRKKGRRATGEPAYGYMMDPERKAMDVIDPEAAGTVRRIFDMAIAGIPPREIARTLNDDGVPTPAQHFRTRHPGTKKFAGVSDKGGWTYSSVHAIIRRYCYTGAAVGGFRKLAAPCSKVSLKNAREEWTIVPGMHEAIVTEEEYRQANSAIRETEQGARAGLDYPLKSLVVCASCGRRMTRYKDAGYFSCPYGRYSTHSACRGMASPKEADMEAIALREIRGRISLMDIKIKGRRRAKAGEGTHERRPAAYWERMADDIRKEKLAHYEDYCAGRLSREDFLSKKERLDTELADAESEIQKAREAEALKKEDDSAYSEAESACNVFRDEGLTYEMAHAFIDRILVHSKDRIEIQWKFHDFLEEPTGTEEHEKE